MKKTFLSGALCLFCFYAAFSQEVPLQQWAHNHPDASVDLGNWVKKHPHAAHELFEWDAAHPLKSHEICQWAIAHPREKLGAFMAEHKAWPGIEVFAGHHAEATEEFLFWCRNHAAAATALMERSGGLAWAGNHLYKEYWNLETPGKK